MLPLLLKPELLMTLHDPEANFEFDPLVDPSADEELPFLTHSPAEPRAVLARVLGHLANTFVGDDGGPLDAALTTVALLLTRWLCCPFPLRFVVAGGTGTGKTRLLHAISTIARVPAAIVPVTQLAESTWQGLQLGDSVRTLFPEEFTRRGGSGRIIAPTGVLRPCCLMIDEVDKLALTFDGQPLDGAARAWRLGRQQTLLTALDPLSEVLTRFEDVDGVVRWSTGSSIVVVAGAFPQFAPTEAITAAALQRIGFLAEFCDRVASCSDCRWSTPPRDDSWRPSLRKTRSVSRAVSTLRYVALMLLSPNCPHQANCRRATSDCAGSSIMSSIASSKPLPAPSRARSRW